jgi:hypothetical protein
MMSLNIAQIALNINYLLTHNLTEGGGGHHGRYHMVVGFISTYAISAKRH